VSKDILAVDIREAARQLGLSPRTVATLVSRRELPSCKVGRRRIIPIAALEAFLRSGQPSQEGMVAVTERPGI
jgi:excisionase family DNA binding protein